MDCCVSSSIFACIQVGSERFDIERVAYIQLHKKNISHGGARQLGLDKGSGLI